MKQITAFILPILLLLSTRSFTQERDLIKEQEIEKKLQSIAPEYVDEFRQATIAMDKGDFVKADSIYSIIYENVPSFDPVIRRLGSIKFELGQQTEGIALCEQAVEMSRSYPNLITLVNCLIQQNSTTYNIVDLDRANSLLREAAFFRESKDDVSFYLIKAQIGLQQDNIVQFREATDFLEANFRKEMATHYYAAILAANDGNQKKAEKEIRTANRLGLPDEDMNAFLAANADYTAPGPDSSFESGENTIWNFLNILFVIVIVWVSGIVLLYLVGIILSLVTLRSIEQQIKNNDLKTSSKL